MRSDSQQGWVCVTYRNTENQEKRCQSITQLYIWRLQNMYSPVGSVQTYSTLNIPSLSLAFSGSLVDCCPPLAMRWPNILGVESWWWGQRCWQMGERSIKWPLGTGRGEQTRARSDPVLLEGFILTMFILSLFISLHLCERVITGVKWRSPTAHEKYFYQ